jgi:hypothetical protein
MINPLVTEQSGSGAANELQAEGKTVCYRAIRDRVGGGSPRAILTHLRTWSAKEANTPSAAPGAILKTDEVETYLREATERVEALLRRRLSGEFAWVNEDSAGAGAPSRKGHFSPSAKE